MLDMATDLKTNFIGKFIGAKIDEYLYEYGKKGSRNAVYRDFGRLLDVSPDAVRNWEKNINGIHYFMAEKLALLFNTSVDKITDEGVFRLPTVPQRLDRTRFAQHVMRVTKQRAGVEKIKNVDLRKDARAAMEIYLWAVDVDNLKPATAPIGDRMPKIEAPVVPEAPKVSDKNQRGLIQMFLMQANTFAQTNKLEWVIREDGKLGAKRVTTEEF